MLSRDRYLVLSRACNRHGTLYSSIVPFRDFWSIGLWPAVGLYRSGDDSWAPRGPKSTSDEGGPERESIFRFAAVMWISKTQTGDFTVPFGATQTKQTPPHSKKKEPPRNQTRAAREMAGKARQKWRELWRAMVLRTCGELRSSSGCAVR